MYDFFNTRAFTVVSIIFIVTNPYCVTEFDIIQPYHHTTAMISNIYIDLTLLYADWTCQE